MQISHSKCNILTIGRIQDHNPYLIGNNPISRITSVQDLGITVDHELKFNLHINNIVQRANQRSAQILRCFLSRSPTTLVKALKFTSDQFWSMPLLPGHPPTFITSICLSASSAVSPNAFRDAHICHISNASHI